MAIWPSDSASRVADVCSVGGLIVTALLTGGAIRERNRLHRLIFFPRHVANLQRHCEILSSFLGRHPARDEMGKEVGQTRGDLTSLHPFLHKEQQRTFAQTMDALAAYDAHPTNDSLETLLKKMFQLHTELQNVSEGMRY